MSYVRLSSRKVVEVAGPDAEVLLHGVVTQSVAARRNGEAAFGALLTPQGKISADFILIKTPVGFRIDVHESAAEPLIKRLSVYKLRASVQISLRPELVVAVRERAAAPDDASFDDPRLGALGRRIIGDSGLIFETAATEADYVRRRRALGAPELGSDFLADSMFLTDVNYDALRGVDYRKGCFVGQEVSSRMKRKGEIRRRTLIILFDGAPPPASIESEGSEIGEVLGAEGGVGVALFRVDRLSDAQRSGSIIRSAEVALRVELPAYLEEA